MLRSIMLSFVMLIVILIVLLQEAEQSSRTSERERQTLIGQLTEQNQRLTNELQVTKSIKMLNKLECLYPGRMFLFYL
jgi:hypothetical protein